MDSNKIESGEANINKNGVVLMMEPNDGESEISIKDLIYVILRKMGIILLAAVILGGVLFAYKFFKKTQTSNVLDTSVRLSGETDVQYQTRVQNVDRARDISESISKVNTQIDNQRGYITNSVIMQIDAENEYEAIVQVKLSLDDADSTGSDSALKSAYFLELSCCDYLNDYAAQIGIKPDYIKEVIAVDYSSVDESVITVESDISRTVLIYVTVHGTSQEFIDSVSDLIVEEINGSYPEINKSIARHSMTVLGVQKQVRVDANTRDYQANQTSRLETLQKQIVSYKDSLDQIARDLGVSGRDELLDYFASENSGIVSESASDVVDTKSMLKSALKFGILGFIAGAFLVVAYVVLQYIFGKRILTQAQFFSIFTGVKKIGVLKPSFKRSGYCVKLDIRSEDDSKTSADNNKKLICANYENLTRDCKKILITGTGDKKVITESVKAIGLKGEVKPDIFSNPDILKSIADYDGVVIVEQRKVSFRKDIANEISLICNSGVDIIGAIII